MKFKKLISIFSFTVFIIFLVALVGTYAYYNTSGGNVKTVTGNVSNAISTVFSNSDSIDFNTGVPISEDEINNMASKTSFTLIPNNDVIDDYDISTDIVLSNIVIDDELKVSDFKYRLECVHSVTGNSQIFNGDFLNLSSNSYVIASMSTLDSDNNLFYIDKDTNYQNYSCTLYLWLSDSGDNQNDLMGKHFGANIGVNSIMKKR